VHNNYSVSLIIPAMNESATLTSIIDSVPTYVDEIIVIDGRSKDNTFEIASNHPRVNKVLRQRSRGKGAALSLGFAVATCDLVAIIDADGSMDPAELKKFLNMFPQAEIVKGSRSKKLGGTSADLTIFRDLGNRVLTKLCNVWFKENWTDLAYGYAVVDRKALGKLGLSSYDEMGSVFGHKSYGQGFEIEALIFCRSSKWGFRVLEVASAEHRRISGSSNLRAIRDGFRVLSAIIIEKNRSKPNES
jgi:glycosyltransferase involved in cell wall biosynthesis